MSNGIQFDPAAIRALAQILKDTDLTEIELVEKDSRIRVARKLPAQAAPVQMAWPGPMQHAPAAPPAAGVAQTSAQLAREESLDRARHPGLVASPMVGVAYLSPEPGQPAFV